jgi:hypothetical protein
MEWLIIVPVCLLGGWWLFTKCFQSGDEAIQAVQANPGRGFAGIVLLAVIFFVGLLIIGLLAGGGR